jgi:transcriptional regulator with XRE-family HTH domain
MRFQDTERATLLAVAGRKSARHGDSKNSFGKKLKELRLAAGISLRDFAAKLETLGWEVSEGTWAHVEAGRRILSDTELLLALRVLRKKLSDLES